MRERRWYLWKIPGILAILLILGMMSVSAEPIPDLKGSWEVISSDRYSPSGGFMDGTGTQGPYSIIKQDGPAFAGESSYYDSDAAVHVTHFFSWCIST